MTCVVNRPISDQPEQLTGFASVDRPGLQFRMVQEVLVAADDRLGPGLESVARCHAPALAKRRANAGQPSSPRQRRLLLATRTDRTDLKRSREVGDEGAIVMAAERDDDATPGSIGGDRPPVFDQPRSSAPRNRLRRSAAGSRRPCSPASAVRARKRHSFCAAPSSPSISRGRGRRRSHREAPCPASQSRDPAQRSISSPRRSCSMPSRAQSFPSRSRSSEGVNRPWDRAGSSRRLWGPPAWSRHRRCPRRSRPALPR